jgi:hypothetical protein
MLRNSSSPAFNYPRFFSRLSKRAVDSNEDIRQIIFIFTLIFGRYSLKLSFPGPNFPSLSSWKVEKDRKEEKQEESQIRAGNSSLLPLTFLGEGKCHREKSL